MNLNFRLLLSLIAVIAILLAGCSAQEPPTFSITQPGNGSVLPSNYPVQITLSSRYNANNYSYVRWEIYDNQAFAGSGVADIGTSEIHWAENSPLDGVHHIFARAQAFSNGANQSSWLTTSDVCYWVGGNAPADFCSYQTIVQPSTASTATPVLTPIVIIRPDNSSSGNHGGSGGSGCGQYASQTSCNLAGCSWNPQNSSCSVNP